MLPTPSRFPAQVHDMSKPHHPQKRSAHRPTNNQSSGAHRQEVHYAIIVVNRHICHYPFTVQVVGFEPTAFRSQSGRASQAAPHPVLARLVGIEPTYSGFGGQRSLSNKLQTHGINLTHTTDYSTSSNPIASKKLKNFSPLVTIPSKYTRLRVVPTATACYI